MTWVIRLPLSSDVEALAALHATWRKTYAHLLPAEFFADDEVLHRRRDQWTSLTTRPDLALSVRIAETSREIVGFAAAGPAHESEVDPPRGIQLYMIYLAAVHRGSGVGQALLDAVLGDQQAFLWVAKENPRAHAFYRRNGFELDATDQPDSLVPTFLNTRMVR